MKKKFTRIFLLNFAKLNDFDRLTREKFLNVTSFKRPIQFLGLNVPTIIETLFYLLALHVENN